MKEHYVCIRLFLMTLMTMKVSLGFVTTHHSSFSHRTSSSSSGSGSNNSRIFHNETPCYFFHNKQQQQQQQQQQHQRSFAVTEEGGEEKSSSSSKEDDVPLVMPLNYEEMLRMVSNVINDAYTNEQKNRQIIRLLLPRDPNSGNLGQYYENDTDVLDSRSSSQLLLVPPDETWQGGIMQLYRAAMPMCRDLLRRLSSNKGGLPPKITKDRSIDESNVDGIGMLMAQSKQSPEEDCCCFIQPSQESIKYIESISNQAGKRLTILINPQWRNTNDAFDEASSKQGFFGNIASRLGGKGETLQKLNDLGYESIFTLEGYVCRGGNVRLLKVYNKDWYVYTENDAMTNYILVGTSITRPTYQDIDTMLETNGIALKYARDIGMAPKV